MDLGCAPGGWAQVLVERVVGMCVMQEYLLNRDYHRHYSNLW